MIHPQAVVANRTGHHATAQTVSDNGFRPGQCADFFRQVGRGGKGIHYRPVIIGKLVVITPVGIAKP